MKINTLAFALALSLTGFTAVADDAVFSSIDSDVKLVEMTDQELGAVEGTRRYNGRWGGGSVCFACSNTAIVTQLNMAIGSLGVQQSNHSNVSQGNN